MAAHADLSLRELLDQVAQRAPGPSAGACAAWTSALAASLAELAVPELGSRAHDLRERALSLADRDVAVYGAVLAGDATLSDAADPPLAIAELAADVAALAAEAARHASAQLRGDAAAGVRLAAAAAEAAAGLVAVNLADSPSDPRTGRARDAAARAVRRLG